MLQVHLVNGDLAFLVRKGTRTIRDLMNFSGITAKGRRIGIIRLIYGIIRKKSF